MEVEEIQTQACNFSRIGNGINDSDMIGQKPGERYRDEDEDDTEGKVGEGSSCGGRSEDSPLQAWQSSRICRVSRASCGKDRHSKVYTAKGLRDRRVRLSVSTAIQFYDLQDRLGYDQPSKAVDWLINAASEAIAELPPLNCSFPDTLKQPNHEKPRFHPAEIEPEIEPTNQHHHISFTKSACSSASETSKGSAAAFSLSRNESRVKARERAKEKRVAKEKEKVKGKEKSHSQSQAVQQNVTPTSQSQTFSFTELLTREGTIANNKGNIATTSAQQNNGASSFVFGHSNHSTPSPMDYFNGGLFNQASSRIHHSSGFQSQSQFLSHSVDAMSDNQELQQFSFLPDHYNLNFPISSSLSGFNRGTLQSNSPSPLPHLQRLSSPLDGSNVPLFISRSVSSATTVENHQLSSGFETQLQHRYDDSKGKGRS